MHLKHRFDLRASRDSWAHEINSANEINFVVYVSRRNYNIMQTIRPDRAVSVTLFHAGRDESSN